MADEKDMKDETIVADDKTIVTDPVKPVVADTDTTVPDMDERILASKIATMEEYLLTLMTRTELIMQSLVDIQSKLSLDISTDPVLSDYEKALALYNAQ